jgi:outer membrane protein OmpA-like peptidoglycan-associated protein
MPDTAEESLLFASKDAALRERGTQILDDLIACMEHGLLGDRPLLVVGFADPRGPAAYNYALGLERARSVERYLIRHGVPPERIVIASRGESRALGDGPETWFYDRRVEIRLIPSDGQ